MTSALLYCYRLVAQPLFSFLTLQSSCIYTPSCSHYVDAAIRQHGFWKGVYLGVKRFLRCRPWRRGGYDPVPIQ